jgi:hypothetical protein
MNRNFRYAGLGSALLLVAACEQVNLYRSIDAYSALKKASKETVVVTFEAGCPVEAVALGSSCPSGIGGHNTVCRTPEGGTTSHPHKITWVKDSEAGAQDDFNITFPGGGNGPCNSSTSNKKCHIKNKSDFEYGGSTALIFKYNIVAASGSCELDPYIIVMQ